MGQPGRSEPIRVFVGYSAARTDEERVQLAIDELHRTGAFDRSILLVGCPAGNGYVNTLPLEIIDYLTLGDGAAVAVQYGRLPSFLTLQRVTRGGAVQRLLLEGIAAVLADRPPELRPRIVVYGESLGAWAGQDTFLHQGVAGLDELGCRPRPVGRHAALQRLAQGGAGRPHHRGPRGQRHRGRPPRSRCWPSTPTSGPGCAPSSSVTATTPSATSASACSCAAPTGSPATAPGACPTTMGWLPGHHRHPDPRRRGQRHPAGARRVPGHRPRVHRRPPRGHRRGLRARPPGPAAVVDPARAPQGRRRRTGLARPPGPRAEPAADPTGATSTHAPRRRRRLSLPGRRHARR